MFKVLFHHRSHLINVIEALGVAGLAGTAWRTAYGGGSWLAWTVLAIIVIEYVFIRYCATRRWYKTAVRYEGIELHFKKVLSPTAYVLLIGSIVYQLIPNSVILIAMALLLAVIGHVNVILIHLHRRDKDPFPVNYFSHTKAD